MMAKYSLNPGEKAVQIQIVSVNVVGFYLEAYVSQRRSVSDPGEHCQLTETKTV